MKGSLLDTLIDGSEGWQLDELTCIIEDACASMAVEVHCFS